MNTGDSDGTEGSTPDIRLTADQLRAYEKGWGVRIMPIRAGWKIHYFSISDFETELGTPFTTFEDAIDAVCSVLPAANSEDQRAKARAELRRLLSEGESSPE